LSPKLAQGKKWAEIHKKVIRKIIFKGHEN
jgi:hypothetical protein